MDVEAQGDGLFFFASLRIFGGIYPPTHTPATFFYQGVNSAQVCSNATLVGFSLKSSGGVAVACPHSSEVEGEVKPHILGTYVAFGECREVLLDRVTAVEKEAPETAFELQQCPVLLSDGTEVTALVHIAPSHIPEWGGAVDIASGDWEKRHWTPMLDHMGPLIGSLAATSSAFPVRYLFVYGTLRPDNTSGAIWTAAFAKGNPKTLRTVPARVIGIKMYYALFPFVCLPAVEAEKLVQMEKKRKLIGDSNKHVNYVEGYAVGSTDTDEFREKLLYADHVEGWPSLYQRGVVVAEVCDTGVLTGEKLLAFIYYRSMPDVKGKVEIIESGNFVGFQQRTVDI